MKTRMFRMIMSAAALLPLPYFVGCTEKVTDKDVQAARDKASAEQMDVAKARSDAEKKISAETQEARKAEATLSETETKAAATKHRDQFVAEMEAQLQAADRRIDELKAMAGTQEGTAKDATNAKIKDIQAKRDAVSDSLGKVKSAELLQWQVQQPAVQQAADDLRRSMA